MLDAIPINLARLAEQIIVHGEVGKGAKTLENCQWPGVVMIRGITMIGDCRGRRDDLRQRACLHRAGAG